MSRIAAHRQGPDRSTGRRVVLDIEDVDPGEAGRRRVGTHGVGPDDRSGADGIVDGRQALRNQGGCSC
jgi:hypothetical protein